MKKFLQMTLVLVISLGFATRVNALSEEELVEHVSKYYSVAGKQVKIEDIYLNRLKNILKEKDPSAAQLEQIKNDFDAAVKIMQDGKQTDPTKLAKADRQRLLELGKDAAAQLEINATYKKGIIYLVGFDGKQYPSVDVRNALEGVLRPTGEDYTVYVAASGLALVILSVVGYRKLKENV